MMKVTQESCSILGTGATSNTNKVISEGMVEGLGRSKVRVVVDMPLRAASWELII